jgi:hypothetical protein
MASLLLVVFAQAASGQSIFPNRVDVLQRPRRATGILTDRLTRKQLEKWKNITQVALAENLDGKPLYPTLHHLWDWLNLSGHAVYIELPERSGMTSGTAGSIRIEHFDPEGVRHVAIIRLYLNVIDLAYDGPSAARENGFIPFTGLGRHERYAEVLGHEMAHAVDVLSDVDLTRRVEELVEQTNDLFHSSFKRNKGLFVEPELQIRLHQRDAFLGPLEARAEMIEEAVWRELTDGKQLRMALLRR